MAFVLVESLAKNKSRFVQMSCKIMELLLLSVGLISMVVVMKDSLRDFVFSISMGFWDFITCFFSSPPTVIIAINLMVLLIFASSTFYSSHQITTGDESPPAPAPSDVVLQVTPPAPPLPPAPAPSDVVLQVTPPAPPLPPAQPPSAIKSSINATQLQRGGRYDATHQLPSPKPQPPSRVIQARNNTTLTSGGRENIFRDIFGIGVSQGEKLLKASQCYLSTTAGPIAGILFISTHKICFCSERSIAVGVGGLIRIPYKVSIPVNKIKAANESGNLNNSSHKYIHIVTQDEFEFWFMGFLRYEKAVLNLQRAISMST